MCLSDALDDCQSEAEGCVVRVYPIASTLKPFDEGGDQPWREHLARVLDIEHHSVGLDAGRNPHSSLLGEIVDDRVVHEVRRQLQQERLRANCGCQFDRRSRS